MFSLQGWFGRERLCTLIVTREKGKNKMKRKEKEKKIQRYPERVRIVILPI